MTNVVKFERGWFEKLHKGRDGPRPILANVMIVLRECPDWQRKLFYDVFSQRIMFQGEMPFSDGYDVEGSWTDAHDTICAEWMQNIGIFCATAVVSEAVKAVASENQFHPVRDYLDGLVLDPGTNPADTWLYDYLGVQKTPFTIAAGRCWLISAVARIYEPGCKVDTALILEGPQGAKKSTALKVMGGDWFTDEIADFGSKDASMQMAGAWIIELAELDHLTSRAAEMSRVKAFMSRSVDRYVKKWGRHAFEQPRECVFAGTVNHDQFFKDETGNRRFWPVTCGDKIDVEGLKAARDQLWAHAKFLYFQKTPWWLPEFLRDDAKAEQDARYIGDVWEHTISNFLVGRTRTTLPEVMESALSLLTRDRGQADQNRAAKCLRRLGWKRKQLSIDGERPWFYVKLEAPERCTTLEEVMWRDRNDRGDIE